MESLFLAFDNRCFMLYPNVASHLGLSCLSLQITGIMGSYYYPWLKEWYFSRWDKGKCKGPVVETYLVCKESMAADHTRSTDNLKSAEAKSCRPSCPRSVFWIFIPNMLKTPLEKWARKKKDSFLLVIETKPPHPAHLCFRTIFSEGWEYKSVGKAPA